MLRQLYLVSRVLVLLNYIFEKFSNPAEENVLTKSNEPVGWLCHK